MKKFTSAIIALSFFSVPGQAVAKQARKKDKRDIVYERALKNYNNQNYFTALDDVAMMYKFSTPDRNTQTFLQKLVLKTGTYYFNTYGDRELRKMNIPTTDLIMAKRNLYLKKYHYVHKRLKRMPRGHRLYPESLLVKATAYYMDKKYDQAVEYYNKCADEASDRKGDGSDSKLKNYFAVIEESCILDVARLRFKQGEFEKAIRHYEDIPKTSIKWPYILMEKAWSYYYLGDYNRSLGILITYNSPLLESYFMPEAEVLKALNYYQLCLYPDALNVVNQFYNTYKPKSDALKKVVNGQRSKYHFFELMFQPLTETEQEHKFLRNIITQVSKRVKYSLDLNSLYAINSEIFLNHKDANMKKLLETQKDLKEQINHYVKTSIIRFINETHSLSEDMFNLKLEILAKQRDLVYKQEKLAHNRSRGSFENVDRKAYQEFWTFNNSFWADELGDYSFGLKSNCSVKGQRRR